MLEMTSLGSKALMLRTLSEESIHIQMICTAENKASVVIDEKDVELAVRAARMASELDP